MPRWGLTGDDIYLTVVEFGFVGGLVFGYLPVLLNGATGVLLNRWKPEEALRLIEEHRCTYVLAMPTHAADMIRAASETDRDLSSMRVLAGPGLTPERRVAMQEAFGVPPLGDYGLSEVPGHAAHAPDDPEEKILRTEGRPYDGTEIRIVGEDEQPLPAGEVGAVIVNGPSRFLGFFNNDDLTRESLTDWGGYRTGDLGSLDEDGHFVYVGRSKDIIRRGGVTIVPAEVEPVILRHPAVHEVAIVPLPDDRLGERACAAIIAHAGPDRPHARRAAGVPRGRGRGQVHLARVRRGLRGVPAHAVAEGRQARRRQAHPRAVAGHRVTSRWAGWASRHASWRLDADARRSGGLGALGRRPLRGLALRGWRLAGAADSGGRPATGGSERRRSRESRQARGCRAGGTSARRWCRGRGSARASSTRIGLRDRALLHPARQERGPGELEVAHARARELPRLLLARRRAVQADERLLGDEHAVAQDLVLGEVERGVEHRASALRRSPRARR